MKIISKFRDYYDGLASTDRDPTPVYVRETRQIGVVLPTTYNARKGPPAPVEPELSGLRERWYQIPGEWSSTPKGMYWGAFFRQNSWGSEIIRASVIGFCGRLYPVWHVIAVTSTRAEATRTSHASPTEAYVAARAYVEKSPDVARRNRDALIKGLADDERLLASTWDLETWADIGPDPFRHWNTPIFTLERVRGSRLLSAIPLTARNGAQFTHVCELNPNLGEQGFAKVMDPQQAWQSIDMFLSSALAANREVPQRAGGDADIAYATGHDPKTSFKKAKTDQ